MTYRQFIAALRAEGLTVIEEKTGGKSPEHHNRNHKGPWGPVHGVLIHHTVTKGHDRTVAICRTGYASLPGPLCHGVICKAGHIHVVGYGRTNHAGTGDADVLRAVKAESYATRPPHPNANTVDGNPHFYGFECENEGDGKDPWPEAQKEAIKRAATAVCRHHRWTGRSVIGHLEWQAGKVDPRGLSMTGVRSAVDKRLKPKPKPAPPAPAPRTKDQEQDARLTALEKAVDALGD
jgi:hypothetical protein